MGMFCALAFVFLLIGKAVPPISSVDFLRYDAKDIIIAISGFVLGPLSAFIITVIVSLIEMVTVGTTGLIGFAMNVIASTAFCVVPAVIYKKFKTLWGAIVGLILGALSMTTVMLLWNYVLTPIYMGYPRAAIASMLVPVFLPFNLIKSGINAALTMLLYKPVVNAMRGANLIEKSEESKTKINIAVIVTCILILAVCVLCVLLIRNII
jgi:riboflavin transporter FmnP